MVYYCNADTTGPIEGRELLQSWPKYREIIVIHWNSIDWSTFILQFEIINNNY